MAAENLSHAGAHRTLAAGGGTGHRSDTTDQRADALTRAISMRASAHAQISIALKKPCTVFVQQRGENDDECNYKQRNRCTILYSTYGCIGGSATKLMRLQTASNLIVSLRQIVSLILQASERSSRAGCMPSKGASAQSRSCDCCVRDCASAMRAVELPASES